MTISYVQGLVSYTNFFLTVLKAGKSEVKMPADPVSGEGRLLGSQMATSFIFFCVLRWWKELGALEPSFIRALIPLTKGPPSCPSHFPETLPPNTITLGVGFKIQTVRGHTHRQSLALFFPHFKQKTLEE